MKLLIVFICFSFIFNDLNAQTDSLSGFTLSELDSLYKTKKKPQEQLPYVLALLQKGEKELDTKDTAYAKLLYRAGSTYLSLRDWPNATSHLEQSIAIWALKMPIHATHGNCLNSLGLVYYYQAKNEETEKYWLQVLKIRKEVLGEQHPNYAGSLTNLAVLYKTMGNYALAEPLYQEALKTRKETLGNKHPQYANSLMNFAVLYNTMGNYALAEPMYQEASNIYKEVFGDKHPDYANSLGNLASLYNNMGNYALSEPLYQEALKIRKEVSGNKSPDYAGDLINLGLLYNDMGNYSLAEPLYLEAKSIFESQNLTQHPFYSNSLNNLANLHKDMGNYTLAEPLYQEALKIKKEVLGDKHSNYASSLNNLANLYSDMGNYALAEPLYQEALKIYKEVLGDKHPDYAQNLTGLAILYQNMGNSSKAESYYSQCFVVKNTNLSTNFSWLPEKGKAAYWQQEKDFYQQLNNYAAQAAATLPKSVVLAYNSNLVAKGLLLESAKEVEDAVRASKDSVTLQVYEDLKKKRRLINNLVSSGTGKKEILDQYEVEADSMDKILVGRLGEYAASKRKFQITWKEVQAALADNEVAIEFARYYNKQDSQYYYQALLLRKDYEYPKLIKLGAEKAIQDIPAGKGFADLYKLIWEPIDTFLDGAEKIYYSPDGVLNNISFAALCSKGTEQVISTKDVKRGGITKTSSKTSECNYLSDKYTLHQLSTSRYLAEGLKTSQADNSILVFGGVNYDEIPSMGDTLAEVEFMEMGDYALAENISRSSTNQSRMEYLPGTQTELQNVQKILQKKQWKIRAFSDKNASENTLKTEIQKESPSVLHIATHGFAFPDVVEKKNDNKTYRDADNPMARCGLLLAGANHSWTGNSKTVLAQTGEDGILTALEVSNLPLKNTKLVVLSACETGLGKIQGTEGVFGLKRGFKLAGVEQIIVSLWSVPDKETMELMDIFYNDLAKTRNAVLSFEKAQKDMRKKYADRPDLWAGFVLVR